MKITVAGVGEQVTFLVREGDTIADVLERPEFIAEYDGAYNKFLNNVPVTPDGEVTPDTPLKDGDVLLLAQKTIAGGR